MRARWPEPPARDLQAGIDCMHKRIHCMQDGGRHGVAFEKAANSADLYHIPDQARLRSVYRAREPDPESRIFGSVILDFFNGTPWSSAQNSPWSPDLRTGIR